MWPYSDFRARTKQTARARSSVPPEVRRAALEQAALQEAALEQDAEEMGAQAEMGDSEMDDLEEGEIREEGATRPRALDVVQEAVDFFESLNGNSPPAGFIYSWDPPTPYDEPVPWNTGPQPPPRPLRLSPNAYTPLYTLAEREAFEAQERERLQAQYEVNQQQAGQAMYWQEQEDMMEAARREQEDAARREEAQRNAERYRVMQEQWAKEGREDRATHSSSSSSSRPPPPIPDLTPQFLINQDDDTHGRWFAKSRPTLVPYIPSPYFDYFSKRPAAATKFDPKWVTSEIDPVYKDLAEYGSNFAPPFHSRRPEDTESGTYPFFGVVKRRFEQMPTGPLEGWIGKRDKDPFRTLGMATQVRLDSKGEKGTWVPNYDFLSKYLEPRRQPPP